MEKAQRLNKENQMRTFFYYLKDPRDGAIRYIGQTKRPKDRLYGHILESKQRIYNPTAKNIWIKELLNIDLEPILEIFEEYTGSVKAIRQHEHELIYTHNNITNDGQAGRKKLPTREVCQYERNTGLYIACYKHPDSAAYFTKINAANIGECCRNEESNSKGRRFAGGYIWSYKKYDTYPLDLIPVYMRWTGKKKILAEKNDFRRIYNSAREAGIDLGIDFRHISNCARGKRNTSCGYKFSFID